MQLGLCIIVISLFAFALSDHHHDETAPGHGGPVKTTKHEHKAEEENKEKEHGHHKDQKEDKKDHHPGKDHDHQKHEDHFKTIMKSVTYAEAVKRCKKLEQTVPNRHLADHILDDVKIGHKDNRTFWVCWDECEKKDSIGSVLHASGEVTPHNPGERHFVVCQSPKVLTRHKRHFFNMFRHFHRRFHHHHHRHFQRHRHHGFQRSDECTCSCSGDPHYRTFNRQMMSFQNICRYVLVQSQNGNCPFSIEGQNWVVGGNRRVSYLHYVVIKMYNQEFRLLRGLKIKVNGQIVWDHNDGQVQIQRRGRRLYFTARQCNNVRVEFNGNNLAIIRIPRSMAGQINGVCGRCDGNPGSDWQTKDGRRVPRRGGQYNGEAIGRSWAVPSDNGRVCGGPMRRPPPRRNFCAGPKRQAAEFQCMALKRNSRVFRACTRRRVLQVDFNMLYQQCVMDVCMMGRSSRLALKVTCDNAQIMADKCETAGIRIPNWRQTYRCEREMIKETDTTKPCEMPPKRGPCRGSHTRYFFNRVSGTCRVFNYGGCGGNANRFDKYTDCMTECAGLKKTKVDDCSSTELSVNLMQKLRTMVTKLEAPAPSVPSILQVTNTMKDVTSQYNVLMKILIEMRKLRAQGQQVKQYQNLQQMIASLMTVVKQAINQRYNFPDNKYLTQKQVEIKNVIEQFRVMNKMYTGKEKTKTFVNGFMKKFAGEDKVIVREVVNLLKGTGNLSQEKSEAIKVLIPTITMSMLEKMSHQAMQNNAVRVKVVTNENLQNIQAITTAAEKRMITV